jgi:hypothetical protein
MGFALGSGMTVSKWAAPPRTRLPTTGVCTPSETGRFGDSETRRCRGMRTQGGAGVVFAYARRRPLFERAPISECKSHFENVECISRMWSAFREGEARLGMHAGGFEMVSFPSEAASSHSKAVCVSKGKMRNGRGIGAGWGERPTRERASRGHFAVSILLHPPSSIHHHPSSTIHPPSSTIHPPSSIVYHPPSIIHH